MGNSFFSGLNFVLAGGHSNHVLCMKRHPIYYGIQYVHKGPVYLSVNDGPVYHLEGPVLFLTSPETLFAYGSPPGTSREHYHICVTGERMKQYLRSGLFPLAVNQKLPYYRILFPDAFLSEILTLIILINNKEKYDFAVCRYEHLLLSIQDQSFQGKETGFYCGQLEQLTKKIMKQPEADFDFHAAAAELGITEKHFLRIFCEAYGMPPHRFVLRQRISKACSLLLLTENSVKSIAYECGFHDPFYFSRLFRKYMQTTPEAYRK